MKKNNLFLKVNSIIPRTSVEGPGVRFCIWVQGCSIRCAGCANSELWSFEGGTSYSTDEIVNMIIAQKSEIEGVTFLGGEPMEQIEAVLDISKRVKSMGLTVVTFTGFEYDYLLKNNKLFPQLLKYTDILIDGKFDKAKLDFTRPWVGSSNQNYYFLSDNYDESVLIKYKNKIELHIDKNSGVFVNGMCCFDEIKNLLK